MSDLKTKNTDELNSRGEKRKYAIRLSTKKCMLEAMSDISQDEAFKAKSELNVLKRADIVKCPYYEKCSTADNVLKLNWKLVKRRSVRIYDNYNYKELIRVHPQNVMDYLSPIEVVPMNI